MREYLKKGERSFFYLFLVGFLTLSFLHLSTGYADNGDFYRSVKCMLEKPAGFSSMWPTAGSEEWNRRFFNEWHDRWLYDPGWPNLHDIKCYSPHKFYLIVQSLVSLLLEWDRTYYSVVSGSILSRLILISIFFALLFCLRRILSPVPFWILALALAVIFLDTAWIAFFNSFYEEQIAVMLLPALGLLLFLYHQSRRPLFGVMFMVCAAMIGSAKALYFYLPLLAAFFVYPVFSGRHSRAKFLLLLLVCQLIAYLPLHLVYYHKKSGITAYHSLYCGALMVITREEAETIREIDGKPIFPECIDVAVTAPGGQECIDKTNSRYIDTAKLLASHPEIGLRMAVRVLMEGRATQLIYLGGLKGKTDYTRWWVFNIVSLVSPYGYNLVALFLMILSLSILLFHRACASIPRWMIKIGLFYGLFGFSQYGITPADGLMDISRHLSTGNYSLTLSFPFIASAIWLIMRDRFHRARTSAVEIS